jgi:hypothetical protein
MLRKSSTALLQNVLLIIWNILFLVKADTQKSNKKLQKVHIILRKTQKNRASKARFFPFV